MKKNLLKHYGFFVLGASIALNAFSEPVVETRSATSSDYPFTDTGSSGDSQVIETTNTNVNAGAASATGVSTTSNNPYSTNTNSNPYAGNSATTPAASASTVSSAAVAQVPGNPVQSVNTFNAMQQDIQDLRGMVEELQYKLQQMEQQQKDRYIDVDRRLQALGGAPAATSTSEAIPSSGDGSAATASTSAASPNPEQEKAEYDAAFNLMTKDKNFEKATKSFSDFVKKYPDGSYTPNALYWLGKLYSFDANNMTKSRDAFQRVVKEFPTSAKASDALYELGVTYDKLGSKDQAKKTLKSVAAQYPGSGAASKAEQYLKEKSL